MLRWLTLLLLLVFAPPGASHAPRLLFIGDSLTGGWFASSPSASYAERVTAALGGVRLDAGNRYGWTLAHSASLMVGAPPPAADVVVIELGTNDDSATAAQVSAIYGWTLATIRRASPAARLVCLGPWRGADYAAIDEVERVACIGAGGRFVDLAPLFADGALHGPAGRATYHGPGDEFHPNDAGHAAIAAAVEAAV